MVKYLLQAMVTIQKHSGIYTLQTLQELPITIDEAWDFFSDPVNLERMTPSHMKFRITSKKPDNMYPGQIITYQVSPFKGYTTSWVTEITQVKEKEYFVDEQRFGPYKMWHHEHRFKKTDNGIIMSDKVSYKMSFGILGSLAHRVFVRKQLLNIFNFRKEILQKFWK
ncbi:SRPBCC family protein [Sunxiuqinia sp. A32]|uniref:SRPBCC family protein n=1 Tax=Sunxiuqinia sp. A32 TaxID=3461496 RepID=UPI0040464C12